MPLRDKSDTEEDEDAELTDRLARFAASKWFTRAWTLQELLAPTEVIFLDQTWTKIAPLYQVVGTVSTRTRVPVKLLLHVRLLSHFSVAQKMSWAAGRQATKIEDRAYSLLGLFGVNIPLLYGERNRAFERLQRTIMESTMDHSIFAWQPVSTTGPANRFHSIMLAPDVDCFQAADNIVKSNDVAINHDPVSMTNLGVRLELPVISSPLSKYKHNFLAKLDCFPKDDPESVYALILRNEKRANKTLSRTYLCLQGITDDPEASHRLQRVPKTQFAKAKHETILIPHQPNTAALENNKRAETTQKRQLLKIILQFDNDSKLDKVFGAWPPDQWNLPALTFCPAGPGPALCALFFNRLGESGNIQPYAWILNYAYDNGAVERRSAFVSMAGATGVTAMSERLASLEEKIRQTGPSPGENEMFDQMADEFEEARGRTIDFRRQTAVGPAPTASVTVVLDSDDFELDSDHSSGG